MKRCKNCRYAVRSTILFGLKTEKQVPIIKCTSPHVAGMYGSRGYDVKGDALVLDDFAHYPVVGERYGCVHWRRKKLNFFIFLC